MPTCKPSTKLIPAAFAWSLLIVCSAIFFGCASEYLASHYSLGIPIYQGIITVFVFSNFALATFKDPGIYLRAHDDESKADEGRAPLYKNADINGVTIRMKWCQTCRFYRPPRCSHCSVCDHCIEVFDHHCPWLNNCIGRRNYHYFFQLLLSLMLDMCSMFAFCLLYVVCNMATLATAQNILLIVVMIVIGLLFIPITALTVFHIFLVSKGKTTNEQTTGKLKGLDNPYSRGCMGNWMMILYGPNWPKLTGRVSKASTVDLDNLRLVYRTSGNVNKVYMESINGLPKNGNHYNRAVGSLSLVSEKDLSLVQSVSKHVSSDWDIPLGASAYSLSLSGHPSVGVGMIGVTNRTYSSSSFPLVQPLTSSTRSLLEQVDNTGRQYDGALIQQGQSSRNVTNRRIASSAGSLSGMAEIGPGMGLPGISQGPFESGLPSYNRTYSDASSAPKPQRTRAPSARSRQAVPPQDLLPLASDKKYPNAGGFVMLDNVNSRRYDKPQMTMTGSVGQGALGVANWGPSSCSQPLQSNAASVSIMQSQKNSTSGGRTRHRHEPESSAGRDRPGKGSVKGTRDVDAVKSFSPKKHQQQVIQSVPALTTMPIVPGSVRRPMSFVKALEVSDQLAVVEQQRNRDRIRHSDLSPQPEEEFQSILEISV